MRAQVVLDSSQLENLHAVQLQMLLEVDRVCSKLQIRYQLAAGSLLGAVRHHGFIPWDDDVDVAMSRRDYTRFLAEAPGLLSRQLFLQSRYTDPAFTGWFAKLRCNDSEFCEASTASARCHHGIYLDIFPFDTVAPETPLGKLHLALVWLARAAQAMRRHKHRGKLSAAQPVWQRVIGPLAYWSLRRIPSHVGQALYGALLTLLASRPPTHVTCLVMMPMDIRQAKRLIRPAGAFFHLTSLPFEGKHFPVPVLYDQVLCGLYGDYMKLPHPDQRVPKHAIVAFRLPPCSPRQQIEQP